MVSELERGEAFKTSPLFGREIGQYHIQIVNLRASKKAPSIADIRSFGLASLLILVALKSEIRRRTSKQLCLLKISGYCHSRKAEE